MRVQRTRSSASPPHSPLTRGPLGGLQLWQKRSPVAVVLAFGLSVSGCHSDETRVAHLVAPVRPEAMLRIEVSAKPGRIAPPGPGGEVLWAIESAAQQDVKQIDYGSLPAGFRQLWPVDQSPRALEEGENVIITVSYPDQGWERIAARKVDGLAFAHGLAAGGKGCSSPRCDEVFAFKRWSDGKTHAQ